MSEIIKYFLTFLCGILTLMLSTRLSSRQKRKEEKEKEKRDIRLKYLDPLCVAVADLHENFKKIIWELDRGEDKKKHLLRSFGRIFDCQWQDLIAFYHECNSGLYQAMASLYITAAYFYRAYKIRLELPFIELSPGDDRTLINHLDKVREIVSGEFGIWAIIQDSLGRYITKSDGSLMNYCEFYTLIGDKEKHTSFFRLLEFYKDIEQKIPYEVKSTMAALEDLKDFLEQSLKREY